MAKLRCDNAARHARFCEECDAAGTLMGTEIRYTRLDGTPVDRGVILRELAELSAAFDRHGIDLGQVERAVLRNVYPRVRRAVRANRRLQIFTQHLRAGQRPPYYGADARGRFAWARRELVAELRAAWPRNRRTDSLQTAVLNTVRLAILVQVYPEYQPGRDVDRGIHARVNRLAVRYLKIQFPFLAAGVTEDRLRRRPSLQRKKRTASKTAK